MGLVAREAFSFWTGHPFDFESWVRTGYVVAHGGNPYSAFWPPVPGASFEYLNTNLTSAAYLPFWPELLGGLYAVWTAVGGGDRFVLYFLLKQPGIAADLLSAWLLNRLTVRWTGDVGRGRAVAAFWCVFPYTIAITAIWGQFDSFVVALLLVVLYARGPIERNVVHGLGIFIKWVTVIFVPLEFFRSRGPARAAFLLALAVPAALTLIVFGLEGWSVLGFGQQGLGSVALSQSAGGGLGMNYAFALTFPPIRSVIGVVPYFYQVAPYAWVPGIVAGGWRAARWLERPGPPQELRAMLFLISIFLLLRWGLYEQYFLYLFGLAALDLAVLHPGRSALFQFTVVLASIDLLVNNDLGLRFVSPVDPGILAYTIALDGSPVYGAVRAYALLALSVAVTLTLIQWVLALDKDAPSPRPWPWALRSLGKRAPREPTSSAGLDP